MEVDTPSAGEVNISPERLEAFSSGLGKYRHAQNVEQMSSIADIEGVVKMSLADIEGVVNSGAAEPYSASEIMSHLKIMQDKSILMIVKEKNLMYFV
ncbi:DNA replication licensing factor MCM3 homolog 2-like isoform X2 [Primulina huaijiensis]|uniref:DNA replication licensing factor MCM3 homolog 2-like isoform X2 n=1 Tax=Primulina huaijiensis TaxID=1492673 RepID=UPI003CC6E6B8